MWISAKRLDELSGVTDWRLHDLRRTVATGMQRLGTRLEVTESALNHISGSKAGIVGVYQTHDYADEKREALNSWAQHVMDIVGLRWTSSDCPNRISFSHVTVHAPSQ